MEEERKGSIYYYLWLILKKIFQVALHLSWVFIRMTIYWITRLLYKVFRLSQIDIARQRRKFNKQGALTNIRHEFVFDRSDAFLSQWNSFTELVRYLDIDEAEKEELVDTVLMLMAETERQAFNTTYNYMITKDLREPSFEDMIIQGIFKTKSDIEPRKRVYNPYSRTHLEELRHDRFVKQNSDYHESRLGGLK